jgi:hypothetical protein
MDDLKDTFVTTTFEKYDVPIASNAKELMNEKKNFLNSLMNPDNPDNVMGITIVSVFFRICIAACYILGLILAVIILSGTLKVIHEFIQFIQGIKNDNDDSDFLTYKIVCAAIVMILLFLLAAWLRV